ncbi:sulfite exporter TauE/SafE family protein [Maridesulfovibrio zosterae]|uniref:sulfite exporter TauE/SafE family protein n=1 Tax=Maridesulfovibrio zosterae TaxID=82171 RepID=UPI00041EFA76|nr:sulfite exporter TauE/SafE family protein [Maridesulfovibrio zosterae]
MIVQALSLGASAGLYCMVTCAPTLAPLILSSPQKGIQSGLLQVLTFLGGRLFAYCMLGVLAGVAGRIGQENFTQSNVLLAGSQIALGALLIAQAFYSCSKKTCPGKSMLFGTRKTIFIAGFLNSLVLCPPILLAFSVAMEKGSPLQGLLFFLFFFLATSIYVLPFSLAAIRINPIVLKQLSRVVCVCTGCFFIYRGLSFLFLKQYVVY